jgi:hypothetical protein
MASRALESSFKGKFPRCHPKEKRWLWRRQKGEQPRGGTGLTRLTAQGGGVAIQVRHNLSKKQQNQGAIGQAKI